MVIKEVKAYRGAGFGIGAGGAGGTVLDVGALTSFSTGLGKGLTEPCSPYRLMTVFGAELNVPDANNWNCAPNIVGPTAKFDVSTITPGHEVVVALLVLRNLPAGKSYVAGSQWYRDRDNKLLYNSMYTIPDPAGYGYTYWAWYYIYSYIGFVTWEIYEDGNYHVDLFLDGSVLQTLPLAIVGTAGGIMPFTDIFQLDVPVTAKVGDIVGITVGLENISPVTRYVTVTGNISGTPVYFGNDVKLMGAGGIATFYESFIMPDHDVSITVWSFTKFAFNDPWVEDDSMQVSIPLEGAPAEDIAGEIEYVHVLVSSLEQPVPADGIEVGDRFYLRVKVKNTGIASFKPYLYYKYTKPDGSVLGSTEGKFLEFDPGNSHVFSEPAFGIPVDQPGIWKIYCELRSASSGNAIDTFSEATLFIAGGVIPYTDLANVDIVIAAGTYEIGESVPFRLNYDYRGPAQPGFLSITLRALNQLDYVFPEIVTELVMSTDWKSGVMVGAIKLPGELTPGATYMVVAVLRTEDNKVEKTDVDLNIITVYEVPPLTGTIGTMQLVEVFITKDLPALDMVKNDFFSVLVPVTNTSSYEGRFFLDCIITKPSGAITGRENEQQNLNPEQNHTYEIQPEGFGFAFRIDETGDWYVESILKSETEELARTGQVHLFTAGSSSGSSDLRFYDLVSTLPSEHPILGPLDTLEIGVTFKYTSTEDVELQLWASLALGIGRDIESFTTIYLTKSLTEKVWTGTAVLQVPESGKRDGEYDLRVEIDGLEVTTNGAVTLIGMILFWI